MGSHDEDAEAQQERVEAEAHANEDVYDEADDTRHVEGDLAGDLGGFAAALERERLRLGPTTDSALAALLDAGPEAVEHLLKAAQELLLAAKAVVDAGERAVESHRASTDAPERTRDAPERDARVRRIDLA
ncbi:MAG TPA: hypothetical protein VEM59_03150 [Acidimicrobiia bacterium]|nr:hypothetical protein [Acidimicrobiia bacterium]